MEAGAKALRKLAAEAAENALLNCSVAQGIVSLKGLRQSGATGQGTGSPGNRPATCFDVFTAATVFSMDSRGSSRASRNETRLAAATRMSQEDTNSAQ